MTGMRLRFILFIIKHWSIAWTNQNLLKDDPSTHSSVVSSFLVTVLLGTSASKCFV